MANSPAMQQAQAQAQQGHGPHGPKQRILRIGIILGGKIVEERMVRERVDVTIGQATKNTFSVPVEGLPRSHALFTIVDGHYYLNYGRGMDGRISDGGQVYTLESMKGHNAKQHGDMWVMPLPESARGKIVVGDMTLLFQFVTAPPLQPRPQLPASVRGTITDRIDPRLAVILAISIIFHATALVYAWYFDREATGLRSARLFNETFQRPTVSAEELLIPTEKTGEEPTEAAKVPEKGPEKKPEKAATAKTPDKKPDTGGGGRSESDKVALEEDAGRIADSLFGEDESEDAEGRGDIRNRNPGSALGDQIEDVKKSGEKVGVGGGSGRGTRGDGEARTGTGKGPDTSGAPGDTTSAGTKGTENIPRSRISAGGKEGFDDTDLTPDEVVRIIMSKYKSGLERCHKELLKRDPSAGGKVTLEFTVAESGKATNAKVKGFDPEVETCIKGKVAGWLFPKPKDSDGEPTTASFKITLALQAA
jgi:outer membrane biosynthesis protein TonB